ncbi:MAG: hypothetical protein JXB03_09770 [Spirochaetales bacterium]|nr:hypothetical protein [Spirochaetales bacterium]
MKYVSVSLIVIVSLFLLAACGASNALNGEYICTKHFSEELAGEVSLVFQKDGTVEMKPINQKGEYKVEGDKVTLSLEYFDLTFTKDGNTLTSSDKTTVYEKK